MSKKAFSLIELSIVVLIIGILVAGITQGSKLIQKFRIKTAQNLTQSSPVSGIKNLVSWYETTSEASFDSTIDAVSNNKVSNWYDISLQVERRNNATQTTEANRPIYTENDINGLPTLKFTESQSQSLKLPDGTVPYNNSPYTIFIVAKADKTCTYTSGDCGLLTGGTLSTNQANAFRYNLANAGQDKAGFHNPWWGADATTVSSTLLVTSPHIVVFYYNQKARRIIFNGSEQAMNAGATSFINNQATAVDNYIGRVASNEYLTGSIAEIIIFDRALMAEEIDSIESYLSKKWGIKNS